MHSCDTTYHMHSSLVSFQAFVAWYPLKTCLSQVLLLQGYVQETVVDDGVHTLVTQNQNCIGGGDGVEQQLTMQQCNEWEVHSAVDDDVGWQGGADSLWKRVNVKKERKRIKRSA